MTQTPIVVTLPDGVRRSFPHPVTVMDLAAAIGAGLASNTVAGMIDGRLVDACAGIGHRQDDKAQLGARRKCQSTDSGAATLFGHRL